MPPLPYKTQCPIDSLESLQSLAHQLAPRLQPGDVVTLDGPLGAGKTTFIRLLGEALGLKESVTSPTFVLMHEYLSGPIPLVHVDLYRLGENGAESLIDELAAVMDEGQAILLIEWACYGTFLQDWTTVAIEIAVTPDQQHRTFTISSQHPLFEEGSP